MVTTALDVLVIMQVISAHAVEHSSYHSAVELKSGRRRRTLPNRCTTHQESSCPENVRTSTAMVTVGAYRHEKLSVLTEILASVF